MQAEVPGVAQQVYGAEGVDFSKAAERMLRKLEQEGLGGAPVCIA